MSDPQCTHNRPHQPHKYLFNRTVYLCEGRSAPLEDTSEDETVLLVTKALVMEDLRVGQQTDNPEMPSDRTIKWSFWKDFARVAVRKMDEFQHPRPWAETVDTEDGGQTIRIPGYAPDGSESGGVTVDRASAIVLAYFLLDAANETPEEQAQNSLFFCPTAGEIESAGHSGFATGVCCDHPELHVAVPDTPAIQAISQYLSERAKAEHAARCPSGCDDDCEVDCHEEHAVPWKRHHDPQTCPSREEPTGPHRCPFCSTETVYRAFSGGKEWWCPGCETSDSYESGRAPGRAGMLTSPEGRTALRKEAREYLAGPDVQDWKSPEDASYDADDPTMFGRPQVKNEGVEHDHHWCEWGAIYHGGHSQWQGCRGCDAKKYRADLRPLMDEDQQAYIERLRRGGE